MFVPYLFLTEGCPSDSESRQPRRSYKTSRSIFYEHTVLYFSTYGTYNASHAIQPWWPNPNSNLFIFLDLGPEYIQMQKECLCLAYFHWKMQVPKWEMQSTDLITGHSHFTKTFNIWKEMSIDKKKGPLKHILFSRFSLLPIRTPFVYLPLARKWMILLDLVPRVIVAPHYICIM